MRRMVFLLMSISLGCVDKNLRAMMAETNGKFIMIDTAMFSQALGNAISFGTFGALVNKILTIGRSAAISSIGRIDL